MSHSDRTVPPGQGRIAAAAWAGMFARSGTFVSGLVLLASAGAMALTGDLVGVYVHDLMRNSLEMISLKPEPGSYLAFTVKSTFFQSIPFLTTIAIAALLGVLVPALVAKRNHGTTAVPLPKMPRNRIVLALLHTAGAGLFLLIALLIFRRHVGSMWQLFDGDIQGATLLFAAFCELTAAAGVVLLLVGITEIATLRHTIWRALFLDSMDAKRENRVHHGDSAVRSNRMRRAVRRVRG